MPDPGLADDLLRLEDELRVVLLVDERVRGLGAVSLVLDLEWETHLKTCVNRFFSRKFIQSSINIQASMGFNLIKKSHP